VAAVGCHPEEFCKLPFDAELSFFLITHYCFTDDQHAPVRDILVPSLSVFIWPSLRHAIVVTSCSLATGVFFLFDSTMHRTII
jgi:hypothetical protein